MLKSNHLKTLTVHGGTGEKYERRRLLLTFWGQFVKNVARSYIY